MLKQEVSLTPGLAKYLGNEELVQFKVVQTKMISKDSDYVVVEITLRRMISYHMVSTFAPTLLLLVIAIITLFLDESHFEATIMLAITAMLVMYTLYETASSGLPKTAYLKMIDIWLIFGLVVPFIVFLVEIFDEIMRKCNSNAIMDKGDEPGIERFDHNRKSEEKSGTYIENDDCSWVGSENLVNLKDVRSKIFRFIFEPSSWSGEDLRVKSTITKKKQNLKIKFLAQILVPSLCFVFTVGYIICAAIYYNS